MSVVLVTDAPTFRIVDGMVEFTLASGEEVETFRISLHRARSAAVGVSALLDAHEREQSAKVRVFRKRGEGGH